MSLTALHLAPPFPFFGRFLLGLGAFHDAAPPESPSRTDRAPAGPGGSQLALPGRGDLEVPPLFCYRCCGCCCYEYCGFAACR